MECVVSSFAGMRGVYLGYGCGMRWVYSGYAVGIGCVVWCSGRFTVNLQCSVSYSCALGY